MCQMMIHPLFCLVIILKLKGLNNNLNLNLTKYLFIFTTKFIQYKISEKYKSLSYHSNYCNVFFIYKTLPLNNY